MNTDIFKMPFYAKVTIFLIGIIALFAILYIGQGIIIPLVFAIMIAMVLHPVQMLFVRMGLNRIIAITITLVLAFLVIAGIFAALFTQASRFGESWPTLVDKFSEMVSEFITWFSAKFDVNPQKIHDWINKGKGELLNSSGAAIGKTLVTVGSLLMVSFLIPVYVFIILYYQPLFFEFTHKLFDRSNHGQVNEIINQIKTLIQKYLVGLLIEAAIIATLNSVGLLILGIDYAILLGIIGAMVNVIPYIGGVVAVALPMIVAITTKSTSWYALYVLAVYYFIQLIDNHYIVPNIVASKVKINALFAIVVVLVGNALWGIPGMFLSLPSLAIVKVIFDRIEPLKPWGFLIGDTMPVIKTKRNTKKYEK